MAVFQKQNSDVRLDIEISNFSNCLSMLSAKLGPNSYKEAMRFEVGKILQAAAERTKASSVAMIKANNPPPGENWSKGTRWATIDGKKYRWDWRLKNKTWKYWKTMHAQKIAVLSAKIGLAQHVWVEIAKKLGLTIAGTAKSQTAKTRSVPMGSLANAMTTETPEKLIMEISNLSKYARFANADQALFSAIKGRNTYFAKNLAAGVFKDAKRIAAKYPGITITQL
jgi:hypothetical protein